MSAVCERLARSRAFRLLARASKTLSGCRAVRPLWASFVSVSLVRSRSACSHAYLAFASTTLALSREQHLRAARSRAQPSLLCAREPLGHSRITRSRAQHLLLNHPSLLYRSFALVSPARCCIARSLLYRPLAVVSPARSRTPSFAYQVKYSALGPVSTSCSVSSVASGIVSVNRSLNSS